MNDLSIHTNLAYHMFYFTQVSRCFAGKSTFLVEFKFLHDFFIDDTKKWEILTNLYSQCLNFNCFFCNVKMSRQFLDDYSIIFEKFDTTGCPTKNVNTNHCTTSKKIFFNLKTPATLEVNPVDFPTTV